MKYRSIAIIAALTLMIAAPVFAQTTELSASQSMHAAGESVENAAASSAHAAEHVYHGAKTAVKDTAITAKVKTALKDNRTLRHDEIHVSTTAGVVTLKGDVPTPAAATKAENLAKETEGVKDVHNELMVMNTRK
jgi:hyperosmotically inducible periplasmic protein